jgi:GntR family transcriptional repressor for pyruvate dehydrogenase complex
MSPYLMHSGEMGSQQPVLRVHKTGEIVAGMLRSRIVSGELPIGSKLPTEEELTEAFGIARTTLREALRILESQGLIHIKRGRGGGGTVTMPDLSRLSEAFAAALQLRRTSFADLDTARRLIEPELAAWLARAHTPDDEHALSEAALSARDAANANDHRRFASAATRFHRTIVERAGNTTLSLYSQLLNELVENRYLLGAFDSSQALMQRAARSYAKLVALIAAGDEDAARVHWQTQMTYMIEESRHDLITFYDEATSVGPGRQIAGATPPPTRARRQPPKRRSASSRKS